MFHHTMRLSPYAVHGASHEYTNLKVPYLNVCVYIHTEMTFTGDRNNFSLVVAYTAGV